jgi:hypothetical protein
LRRKSASRSSSPFSSPKAWYVTRKSSIETYPRKSLCDAPGPVEVRPFRKREKSKFAYNFCKRWPIWPKFLL